MAYWTRSMSLMSAERRVPVAWRLKERDGAAEDGLVEVVTQVGDHAEAGVIGEVGSGVVADALERRGGDEGEGDDGPVVVEVRGDEALEVDMEARA